MKVVLSEPSLSQVVPSSENSPLISLYRYVSPGRLPAFLVMSMPCVFLRRTADSALRSPMIMQESIAAEAASTSAIQTLL